MQLTFSGRKYHFHSLFILLCDFKNRPENTTFTVCSYYYVTLKIGQSSKWQHIYLTSSPPNQHKCFCKVHTQSITFLKYMYIYTKITDEKQFVHGKLILFFRIFDPNWASINKENINFIWTFLTLLHHQNWYKRPILNCIWKNANVKVFVMASCTLEMSQLFL